MTLGPLSGRRLGHLFRVPFCGLAARFLGSLVALGHLFAWMVLCSAQVCAQLAASPKPFVCIPRHFSVI